MADYIRTRIVDESNRTFDNQWFYSARWPGTRAAIDCTSREIRQIRVRFHIIGNDIIKNVGKSQSCMVSKLPIAWKQTVRIYNPEIVEGVQICSRVLAITVLIVHNQAAM